MYFSWKMMTKFKDHPLLQISLDIEATEYNLILFSSLVLVKSLMLAINFVSIWWSDFFQKM